MSTKIRCGSFSADVTLRRRAGLESLLAFAPLNAPLYQLPVRMVRAQAGTTSPIDRCGRSPLAALMPDRADSGSGDSGIAAALLSPQPDGQSRGKLRVLLADDHMLLRQGLAQMLGNQPDMLVVGQANDGQEAIQMAHDLKPEVVLMDITMPNLSGIDATRRMAAELPGVKVIGLSMHDSEELIHAMKEAGASGFVNKADAMDKLLALLRGL